MREPVDAGQAALHRDEAADRTDERNRSSVLDGVRAVAALMVLLAHASLIADNGIAGPIVTALRQMLGAGVLMFFSLSGYLIAGPFLRALVDGRPLPGIRAYLVRRAARIYPGYWLAFAAVLVLLAPAGGVRPYQLPVHLLLLQSSWPVAGEPTAIFFVGWTLGIEAAFYVFVPLAAIALRALHPGPWRHGSLAAVILAGALVSIVWEYVGAVTLAPYASVPVLILRIGLQNYLYAFCPGMLIALAVSAREQHRPWRRLEAVLSRPWLTLPAGAALWLLAYEMEGSGSRLVSVNYQVAFVLASGLFLGTLVLAGPAVRRPVQLLAPVGLVSYGIYLWHDIVVQLIGRHPSIGLHGGALAWAGDCLIVVAITAPLAIFSWFAVERPFMRRAAAWARQHAPVPATAAPAPAPVSARPPAG